MRPQVFSILIQPLKLPVFILHQLLLQYWINKTLPFFIFAKGFEKLVGLLNKILSVLGIMEFTFLSWETCIHPLLFLRSIILLKFSFLSICFIGKSIFLYTNLIGYSNPGPYLTFTLAFFKDRKVSFAKTLNGKKNPD